ncbi:MAG: MBL fold metallo-hydrolase [Rhodobacteraceae bacterium]|nr:MBL fold metallo-hydrolase [Paracoccaceae bacterium]
MERATQIEPGLRLIRANNPSAMTGAGTNSYIIGSGQVCVLDPGPADPQHLRAIMAALQPDEQVAAILVTHSHLDHSPLARELADATGAPVLGFGDSASGRSDLMADLAAQGVAGGGEGVDADFRPDRLLGDQEEFGVGEESLRAIWTPGHMGNHLCFAWRGAVFTGDHVMGWASSLISPPDGDLGAYMRSLEKLRDEGARALYPGHGAPIPDAAARIAELAAHRQARSAAILAQLAHGPAGIAELVAAIYTDTPAELHPAAARNVHAHLIDLCERGLVAADPLPAPSARYRRLS